MRARHAARTQFRLPRQAARFGMAILAALVLMAWAVAFSSVRTIPASADVPTFSSPEEWFAWCRTHNTASFRQQLSPDGRTVLRGCANIGDVLASTSPSPSPSVTPTVQPSVTATPSATTTSPIPSPTLSTSVSPTVSTNPSPSPTPTPSPSPPSGWPGPDNTGVPADVTLTPYTGPCTIVGPTPATIDAKLIGCDLNIRVSTTITRSWISDHTVHVDTSSGSSTPLLSISDSLVDAPDFVTDSSGQHQPVTALSEGLFVADRIEVTGGNRGVLCAWWCTLRDSWVHGTYVEGAWHASAVRAERYSTIVHNTLNCSISPPTAQDGGCSADLTGYPDFVAVHHWDILGNLFVANVDAAFCAYGGATPGKPFSGDPTNATYIRFVGNVFERGPNRQCAAYGPVDSWAGSRLGNVWSGNVWADDGTPVVP